MARIARWAGLGALALAGCTSDGNRRDSRDDPLLGLGARSANQPVAIATANPGGSGSALPAPAYQPRPPLTASVPTSNAALAAGGFQPLPGAANDLRIGSGAPAPGRPVPVPPPGGGTAPVPVPTPGASGAVVPVSGSRGGLEQAYAAAAAREPLFTKLQYNSQTHEYLFIMSVPNKLNSSLPRMVEATAATPVDAIYRALEQLGNGS